MGDDEKEGVTMMKMMGMMEEREAQLKKILFSSRVAPADDTFGFDPFARLIVSKFHLSGWKLRFSGRQLHCSGRSFLRLGSLRHVVREFHSLFTFFIRVHPRLSIVFLLSFPIRVIRPHPCHPSPSVSSVPIRVIRSSLC
jgi:hypothetical protein